MTGSKEDYINYRVSKSKEAFNDAELLFKNSRWNLCINRLYFACYYLVTALLYKHQIKAHTHKGTKSKFFLHFVKTNKVGKEFGKLYSNLFGWRQESDYADFIDFDKNMVKPILDKTKEFLLTVEKVLKD